MPSLETIYYAIAIVGSIWVVLYAVGRTAVFVVIAVYKIRRGEPIWPVLKKGGDFDDVDVKVGDLADRSTVKVRDLERALKTHGNELKEHRTDDLRRFERAAKEITDLRGEVSDGFGDLKRMIGNVEGQLKLLTRR